MRTVTPQSQHLHPPLLPNVTSCAYDGVPSKNETAPGWVIGDGADKGALGDGYYKGSVNVLPYTISTALSGGVFQAESHQSAGARTLCTMMALL